MDKAERWTRYRKAMALPEGCLLDLIEESEEEMSTADVARATGFHYDVCDGVLQQMT